MVSEIPRVSVMGSGVVQAAATPTDVALSSFIAMARVGIPVGLLTLLVGFGLLGGYMVARRLKR